MKHNINIFSDEYSASIVGQFLEISDEIGGAGAPLLSSIVKDQIVDLDTPNLVTQVDSHIRSIFQTAAFAEIKKIIVQRAASYFDLPLPIHVQITPTARIVLPGAHATSFHTDYWYGHGVTAHTIWTSLTPVERGNAVGFVKDPLFLEVVEKRIQGPQEFDQRQIDKLCDDHAWRGVCGAGDSIGFSSTVVHGSPANTSDVIRLSFDFRIFHGPGGIGSKDWDNYELFDGKVLQPTQPVFEGKDYLKYVCGGRGVSTRSQHYLIHQYCKMMGINIVAQEAELERFGFPVLKHYLSGFAADKKFDGIVLFGRQILDSEIATLLEAQSDVEIVFCAENEHVNLR